MKFFAPSSQNPPQVQQQQQQQLQQVHHHHQQHQQQHQQPQQQQQPLVMNSMNAMNGPSNIINNSNHIPQGMTTGMGSGFPTAATASPLLSSSSTEASSSDVGGVATSNDANDAKAAASSSAGMSGGGGAASTTTGIGQLDPSALVLSKKRLQDLVKEIDPMEVLDEEVEDVLLQIADDFIENVVTSGCMMAKHRKSSTLEVKDVQLHLQRNWNMWIPGFGSEELRPYKKAPVTDAHKQRLALIKKTLKKF